MRARVVAAATALWLVVCGVLAAQHEATVIHVRDSAGAYMHGRALVGQHAGHSSDFHGQRNPRGDAGECTVLNAFHQAASAHVTAPAVVTAACATHVQDIVSAAAPVVAAVIYRLAPKTSPPQAA